MEAAQKKEQRDETADWSDGAAQASRIGVNREDYERVTALIGREEEAPRWIDGESAGAFPLDGMTAEIVQLAGIVVNGVDHDVVVAAVEAVHPADGRMDLNVRATAASCQVRGQGGD